MSDTETTLLVAVSALEQAIATRDAALDALRGLLALLERQGGFMSHDDQALAWRARACLAEHGR